MKELMRVLIGQQQPLVLSVVIGSLAQVLTDPDSLSAISMAVNYARAVGQAQVIISVTAVNKNTIEKETDQVTESVDELLKQLRNDDEALRFHPNLIRVETTESSQITEQDIVFVLTFKKE